jgi:hypothetical protein
VNEPGYEDAELRCTHPRTKRDDAPATHHGLMLFRIDDASVSPLAIQVSTDGKDLFDRSRMRSRAPCREASAVSRE